MKAYVSYSDGELIKLYQNNADSKAFETLLYRYKDRIFQSIYLIVKDHSLAEDLFQNSFIKIINKLNENAYNEEGKFLPWALRIAHNLTIDYVRKIKRSPKVVDASGTFVMECLPSDNTFNSNHKIEQSEQYKRLEMLIMNLPEDQREVLLLRHYANMSFKEIAEKLNCSINTALGRMRYALINLKKQQSVLVMR